MNDDMIDPITVIITANPDTIKKLGYTCHKQTIQCRELC